MLAATEPAVIKHHLAGLDLIGLGYFCDRLDSRKIRALEITDVGLVAVDHVDTEHLAVTRFEFKDSHQIKRKSREIPIFAILC